MTTPVLGLFSTPSSILVNESGQAEAGRLWLAGQPSKPRTNLVIYFSELSSCFASASSLAFAMPASIVELISSPSAVARRVFSFRYSG